MDGSAAIGEIRDRDFLTHYSYPAGSFAKNWTAISDVPLAGGKLLFYDIGTGSAAVGLLTPNAFAQQGTYAPGSFGTWSHIAATRYEGYGRLLFYNAITGAAAIGFDPTIKSYPPGQFAAGWSHIVPSLSSGGILFYNQDTGSGAVGFDPSEQAFAPGAFGTRWSQITSAPTVDGEDVLVFYRESDRSGALGRLGPAGFRTVLTYGPGSFGTWSHVVGFGRGFYFYNQSTGAAAIAAVDNERIVTVRDWPAGAFKAGWTHVVRSSNSMQFAKLEGYAWPQAPSPESASASGRRRTPNPTPSASPGFATALPPRSRPR